MTSTSAQGRSPTTPGASPMILERPKGRNAVVRLLVFVPLARARRRGTAGLGLGSELARCRPGGRFYFLSCFGVTVGFHRYFTHRAFKANRGLRDRAGDRRAAWPCRATSSPGSPITAATTPSPTRRATRTRPGCSAPPRPRWRAGSGTPTSGWTFNSDRTNAARFAPDLLADPDISRIDRQFPLWTVVSLLAPGAARGPDHLAWWGALTAFFWAGLVRIACCTTSPGRSTRSATWSAPGPGRHATAPPTSGRWPSPRWASPGTTCTTPTPPAPDTASPAARST